MKTTLIIGSVVAALVLCRYVLPTIAYYIARGAAIGWRRGHIWFDNNNKKED